MTLKVLFFVLLVLVYLEYKEKEEAEPQGEGLTDSPIAQLVRALH